jgi:hypothetical protein
MILYRLMGSILVLTVLAVCSAKTISSPSPNQIVAKVPYNLVTLFLVKRDNLNNKYRGEIYPIALSIDDRYVEVQFKKNNDVTLEAKRTGSKVDLERLTQLNQNRSFLSAIKNFTIVQRDRKIGKFKVNRLTVSQFSCDSMLVGQGKYHGNDSLQTLFERIPKNQSGGLRGFMRGKEFDESWRMTLAFSQSPTIPSSPRVQSDTTRYRKDLLSFANTLFAQNATTKSISGETTIEAISVEDLDRDGKPEVFGIVKRQLNSEAVRQLSANKYRSVQTAHTILWLNYSESKPVVIFSEVEAEVLSASRFPTLLGTVDVNGDGVKEVVLQTHGYESTGFAIYTYKRNKLNQVFNGSGYGC